MKNENLDRRKFMGMVGVSTLTASLFLPGQSCAQPAKSSDNNINHIGPMAGYAPQIGTLISMLDWISDSVIRATKNFTVDELDRLHDKDSNSIGALMLHVAATEVVYQEITSVLIGEEIACTIKLVENTYLFTVNGVTASLPRGLSSAQANGYQQYPYFGGIEVAPHVITIQIKNI